MTDSRTDAQSSVVIVNDKPAWELAAPTVAYPLTIKMGQKYFEVYVFLKPYAADDLVQILNAIPGSYRRNTADVEMSSGDVMRFAQLTDTYFDHMEPTDNDDPRQQQLFLNRNPMQKVRIARDLLGGADIKPTMPVEMPTDDASKLELLPLAMDCGENILPVFQEIYDPVTKKKVEVVMEHRLRSETEQDWRRFLRTGNESFNKATKDWKSSVNWWKRIELYDDMVQAIDGMVINGQPCNLTNKQTWLPKVPAWHKLLVVNTVFDETRVKND